MKRLQAYPFQIEPNGEQLRDLRRFVYNKALATQKALYEQGEQKLSYAGLCQSLVEWKGQPELYWLAETPSQALQQTLKNLERGYKNFFEKRAAFLHKTTTTISQNHALVCMEDLPVRNMSRSSKATSSHESTLMAKPCRSGFNPTSAHQPPRRVETRPTKSDDRSVHDQKSGLNRSILDQGWGEFRRQLDYKLEWNGGTLLAVPPQNTRRICPCCGHVAKENRQTQAQFLCVDCGYENNADVVGAINVLARGHHVLACGEPAQSGRSVKQEPTEGSRNSSHEPVGIPVL